MCGVRCTPNLAAYCNNGLNLTSRGGGVIFKLLHKLIFKCLITYFSVLYHGERFQIKGTFSKVHRQQKLSLYFPLSFLAKLQIVVTGQFCKPVTLLANSVHYLLQLTYRPRVALFDVGRLLYYNLYPFGILFQYVNFACAIPLNCVAKVQTYLQPTKHFAKNLCIFNLLQQIRLFLPKFIHILSTKTGKCAICKANFFAFRLITYVPYIITNNNAIFVQLLQCVVIWYLQTYNVGYIPNLPPLQN